VMKIFNKRSGRYDDEDRTMATIIAHRIGTKIETAHLLSRVESEKELLNKIIENTNEGVVVINKRHKIVVWNHYMQELSGVSKDDAVGSPAYKIFYTKLGLKDLTKEIYTPSNDGKVAPSAIFNEHQMKSTHGDKVWIGSVFSHILDKNNNPEYTILVVRNISKEKEFLQAKDEFVSVTTHELRTPLTAVKGYLSMIQKGDAGKLSPMQADYFKKAFSATERLSQLVEELLYVFRIDEDRLTYEFSTFAINDIILEAIEDLQSAAKS
jgi:two-component system, OmpR family, sensor histidine kinase VicK